MRKSGRATYTLSADVYAPTVENPQVRARSSRVRVLLSIRLSEAGRSAIQEMAAAERRTLSAMGRILLEEAVAARLRRGGKA
jgi:hypothetical protein